MLQRVQIRSVVIKSSYREYYSYSLRCGFWLGNQSHDVAGRSVLVKKSEVCRAKKNERDNTTL